MLLWHTVHELKHLHARVCSHAAFHGLFKAACHVAVSFGILGPSCVRSVWTSVSSRARYCESCRGQPYGKQQIAHGLAAKYLDNYDFRLRVAKMAALAFLPVADVPMAWPTIKTEFEDDERELANYFEKTWVGEAYARRPGRKAPLHQSSVKMVAPQGRREVSGTRFLLGFYYVLSARNIDKVFIRVESGSSPS